MMEEESIGAGRAAYYPHRYNHAEAPEEFSLCLSQSKQPLLRTALYDQPPGKEAPQKGVKTASTAAPQKNDPFAAAAAGLAAALSPQSALNFPQGFSNKAIYNPKSANVETEAERKKQGQISVGQGMRRVFRKAQTPSDGKGHQRGEKEGSARGGTEVGARGGQSEWDAALFGKVNSGVERSLGQHDLHFAEDLEWEGANGAGSENMHVSDAEKVQPGYGTKTFQGLRQAERNGLEAGTESGAAEPPWRSEDVWRQQTEMLVLIQKQVDLLQALLVKQQLGAPPSTNSNPPASVSMPKQTVFMTGHQESGPIAGRQVAEMGTNTSFAWANTASTEGNHISAPQVTANAWTESELGGQRSALPQAQEHDRMRRREERRKGKKARRKDEHFEGELGQQAEHHSRKQREPFYERSLEALMQRTSLDAPETASERVAQRHTNGFETGVGLRNTAVSQRMQLKDHDGRQVREQRVDGREQEDDVRERRDDVREGRDDVGEGKGDVMHERGQVWLSSRSSSASSLLLTEMSENEGERELGAEENFRDRQEQVSFGNEDLQVTEDQRKRPSDSKKQNGERHLGEARALRDRQEQAGFGNEDLQNPGDRQTRNHRGFVQNGSNVHRETFEGSEVVAERLKEAKARPLESIEAPSEEQPTHQQETRERDLQAALNQHRAKTHQKEPRHRKDEVRTEKAVLASSWTGSSRAPVLKAHLLDIPQIKYEPLSDDDEDSEGEGAYRSLPRGSFSGQQTYEPAQLGGVLEQRANRASPARQKEYQSRSEMTYDGSSLLADLSIDSRRYLQQHGLLQTKSKPQPLKPLAEEWEPDDSLEMNGRESAAGDRSTVLPKPGDLRASNSWSDRSRMLRAAQIEECDSSMFLSRDELRHSADASMHQRNSFDSNASRLRASGTLLAAEASGNLLESVRRKRLPKLK